MTTVYIVMDGNYEPSVDSIFSTEEEAKRRAAALRDGYNYGVEIDALVADDYCYRVDYTPDDGWVYVQLADDAADTSCDAEGYCRTYVRATTHEEAERMGKAKILGYLGKEDES